MIIQYGLFKFKNIRNKFWQSSVHEQSRSQTFQNDVSRAKEYHEKSGIFG